MHNPLLHLPLEQLVWQLNAGGHVFNEKLKPKRSKRKLHKLARAAAQLTGFQQGLLLELLRGERVLVTIGGRSYAIGGSSDGKTWKVCGLFQGAVERSVSSDAKSCSCPDNRFRGRKCKHIEAVEKLP